jgi:thioredoxin reductase (NADPH)
MMQTIQTKVLIIGAGPIGLFAIFMCGMVHMKCCVIEALSFVGGQCQALYPEKYMYDIPAFPRILAKDLVQALIQQTNPLEPQIFLQERAEKIWKEEDLWHVVTSENRHFIAHAIIVCAGAGAFTPKRPPLPEIENFEGKSIFYSVSHPDFFFQKKVIIAGGGDSALDWAIVLSAIAKELHIVHRRDIFRGHDDSVSQLQELQKMGKIHIHTPFQLHSLKGHNGQLSHVMIKNFSDQIQEIETDYMLSFFGLSHDLGPLKSWPLIVEKDRIVINPLTGQTNQPGIYAAGDIATYPHKLKLIVTGFAEAAQIAYHIRHTLFPQQRHSFQHSTSQGIPKDFI